VTQTSAVHVGKSHEDFTNYTFQAKISSMAFTIIESYFWPSVSISDNISVQTGNSVTLGNIQRVFLIVSRPRKPFSNHFSGC